MEPGQPGNRDSPFGFKRAGSTKRMACLHLIIKTQIILFINRGKLTRLRGITPFDFKQPG